ncbi:glycosyltransferase [Thermocrinis sp.]|uniref:glycosyltransferase n=1 Tax=Thermocrinis sp. TaxID=2024383 RepID=UPI002FDCD17B
MKIMDITPYYHSYSGGIRTYIDKKVEWIFEKEWEHVVVIPGKAYKKYQVKRTTFYELPSFPLIGGYRFFRSLENIEEVIRLEKPDLLEFSGTYLPIPFFKKKGIPISVFYHADAKRELSLLPAPRKLWEGLFKLIVDKCLRVAEFILVPSLKYKRELESFGLENVHYVPLGVDTQTFHPSKRDDQFRHSFGIQDNKLLLLYVGRLSPEKGINTLIKLLKGLDPSMFHMLIVGKGPLEFLVKAHQRKLSNLTYMPYINSKEQLAKVYASGDIFVSASMFETFGLAFLEAQSSGLPVCAFDLDLETQIMKETLAPNGDVDSLAESVYKASELIRHNNYLRDYLHKKVKESFSWEITFKSLSKAYESEGLILSVGR